jgi:hypothetical protein
MEGNPLTELACTSGICITQSHVTELACTSGTLYHTVPCHFLGSASPEVSPRTRQLPGKREQMVCNLWNITGTSRSALLVGSNSAGIAEITPSNNVRMNQNVVLYRLVLLHFTWCNGRSNWHMQREVARRVPEKHSSNKHGKVKVEL